MGKFSFGSKKGGDEDDGGRSSLFSRKKSSPAPQSDNPYARQPSQADPYADPAKMTAYQKARAGLDRPAGPQGGNGSYDGGPSGAPRPQAQNAYSSSSSSPGPKSGGGYGAPPPQQGYGSDRYGSGGGYGGNRYEAPSQNQYNAPAAGARGPGGYGGLGSVSNEEPDSNRDALFSGAQERAQRLPPQAHDPPPTYSQAGDAPAGGDYGGYGEQRELTAEEQEEQEYQAILAEKRKVQQESAGSVNRSLLVAQQATEVGQATLARLGAQGERLYNTERHLDLASNQNKIAQDRAAELKTLNRSMFAVHVGNPFTSKQRQMKADEEVLDRHRSEREQREATRRDGYAANQRMESNFKDVSRGPQVRRTGNKNYGKYNLDDEDDEARQLEDQIDDGIDQLSGQVHMMNRIGKAIGQEVDTQNSQINRIMDKSDAVDDQTRMNRERLARIK
ncbi:Protein transport protein-like protein [Emericellopsis cladophorae]|uniref:Protein transport protein-like protein n=1 Tax=Emericellopsis cladophorae TaxID=2686198 RepID=A0A9P9XXE5_9HYPO|nr:Protein transport protein-like protein [Emericellopsis cladophorae]KAI6779114.1 Protein transport protein-like protein [Emericellopsis cladophorae]